MQLTTKARCRRCRQTESIRTVAETVKGTTNDLREVAFIGLRKRPELEVHLLAFVLVNVVLNIIWSLTAPGGFYWPMFGCWVGVCGKHLPGRPPQDAGRAIVIANGPFLTRPRDVPPRRRQRRKHISTWARSCFCGPFGPTPSSLAVIGSS